MKSQTSFETTTCPKMSAARLKTCFKSSSRREEAHSEKSEIRNRKSEIDVSLVTSAATLIRGVFKQVLRTSCAARLLPLLLLLAAPAAAHGQYYYNGLSYFTNYF